MPPDHIAAGIDDTVNRATTTLFMLSHRYDLLLLLTAIELGHFDILSQVMQLTVEWNRK